MAGRSHPTPPPLKVKPIREQITLNPPSTSYNHTEPVIVEPLSI
ncbi:hypothetical protein [Spirulina subsalsa]|nr:hypothetical protein [Spirulina subsalsa]